jgi:hypothetical protein
MSNLSGLFIGIVKKIDTIGRRVAVYLPKLMPAISEQSPSYEENLITERINIAEDMPDVEGAERIKTSPYLWVSLMNADDKMPDIDSRVGVIFLDGQINKGMAFKFNKNSDYQTILPERYSPLYLFSVNDHVNFVREEDSVLLPFPEDIFECVYAFDEKNKVHNYKINLKSNALQKMIINTIKQNISDLTELILGPDIMDLIEKFK